MLKQLFIYILFTLSLCGCRVDFEQNIATPQSSAPSLLDDYVAGENMVISSVTGFVSDAEETPLQDALVTLDGYTTTTDQYGHFFFTEVAMNSEGAVVEITLPNYHLGSQLFYPTSEAMEHLEVILSRVKADSEVDGLSSGIVVIDNGLELEYEANSFLSSNGDFYSGMVNISSSYLGAEEASFSQKALGNLQCVNEINVLSGLVPHSLLRLSFEDENGEQLSINSEVEVYVTIPVEGITEDIYAWYYAPEYGLYTINTEIEKVEDAIRVRIKHNESILLGAYTTTRNERITLMADDGVAVLENTEITLVSEEGSALYTTRSNSLGEAYIPFPTDVDARLVIRDDCGNTVYDESTANQNTEFVLDDIQLKSLEGDVYDCDVLPAEQSVVRILQGEQTHYHYMTSSNFTIRVQTCNQGLATVSALEDTVTPLSSASSMDLNAVSTLGELFTCENPRINQLKITDLESGAVYFYPITSTPGSTPMNTTFENEVSDEEEFKVNFSGSIIGDYSDPGLHSIEKIYDNANGFRLVGDADAFLVLRFGDSDHITIGTFEGSLPNELNSGELMNLKGEFNFYFQ